MKTKKDKTQSPASKQSFAPYGLIDIDFFGNSFEVKIKPTVPTTIKKGITLMIVMYIALFSFAQGGLGLPYQTIVDVQKMDVDLINSKTTFTHDSILLHCFYAEYSQMYIFDGKTRKVIGELIRTESTDLALALINVYEGHDVSKNDDSWIYLYNDTLIETVYVITEINGDPHYLFYTHTLE